MGLLFLFPKPDPEEEEEDERNRRVETVARGEAVVLQTPPLTTISPLFNDDDDDDNDEGDNDEGKLCGRMKRNVDEWSDTDTVLSIRQAASRMESVWNCGGNNISNQMIMAALLFSMSIESEVSTNTVELARRQNISQYPACE